MLHFYYETVVILMLMVVFRPREWPEYFFLNVVDNMAVQRFMNLEGENGAIVQGGSHVLVPLLEAKIKYDASKPNESMDYKSHFNSDEQVLIYNP